MRQRGIGKVEINPKIIPVLIITLVISFVVMVSFAYLLYRGMGEGGVVVKSNADNEGLSEVFTLILFSILSLSLCLYFVVKAVNSVNRVNLLRTTNIIKTMTVIMSILLSIVTVLVVT